MMKKTIQFVPIIAIAMAGTMSSWLTLERISMIRLTKHLTRWEMALLLPMISIGT